MSHATTELADTYADHLAASELQRATRLRDRDQRASFILTRAALRDLLAGQLGCAPRDVPLAEDPGRGPVIGAAVPVAWNVAHAPGCSLVALVDADPRPGTQQHAPTVGIDIEPLGRHVSELVADRLCTPEEHGLFDGLDVFTRQQELLRLWVRKEAVAKADGRGLALPFTAIAIDARGRATLSDDHGNSDGGAREALWVRDLDASPDHVAAVVTSGAPPRPQIDAWPTPP